jgi:sporulation protein YlmC with PRC-barrel domain
MSWQHRAARRGITAAVSDDQVIRLGDDEASLIIGTDVSCTDGACGELSRVIFNPVTNIVTHLAVAPKHHKGLGRLVPIEMVEASDPTIRLRCTLAEFERLDAAEEDQLLPYTNPESGTVTGGAASWPLYQMHLDSMPLGSAGFTHLDAPEHPQPVMADRIPLGEVEVHRGDQVHTSDGPVGVVEGLVIDPRDHHVTHVLLKEGHLWGRKEVAIPISAVVHSDAGWIRVGLSKQEVGDLPAVRLSAGP